MPTPMQLSGVTAAESAGKCVGLPSVQAAECSPSAPDLLYRPKLRELRLQVYDRKAGIKFLIDSGSVISLLPRALAPQKSTPGALQLTAANGSTIATYGQHVLTIDLGLRRAFAWAFTVADVRSAILGADFLAHHSLVVDLKRQRIADVATPCFAEGTTQRATVHGIYVVAPTVHAAEDFQPRLNKIINNFSSLFQPSSAPNAGPTADLQHHIVTTSSPIFARSRRLIGYKLT